MWLQRFSPFKRKGMYDKKKVPKGTEATINTANVCK